MGAPNVKPSLHLDDHDDVGGADRLALLSDAHDAPASRRRCLAAWGSRPARAAIWYSSWNVTAEYILPVTSVIVRPPRTSSMP
mmetsp:Transcript_21166/g.28786  ORF Transcript_21166/g.28786 Transcript_21166/m.28786 type:complete len:83 (-) Transcript_21166:710-958(-)